jgi:hypothetical protein
MLMQSQFNYINYDFDYDKKGVPNPIHNSPSPQNSFHRKRAESLTEVFEISSKA